MENVGSINITYDDYGEIKAVASDEGHAMSLQVTKVFQNLQRITKPSGINFKL